MVLNGGSPPRRSRRGQGDGERVTAKNHERNQPPNGALTVRVGAHEFGDVPNGRRLGLDPAALAAREARPALRAAKVPASWFRSSRGHELGRLHRDCHGDHGHRRAREQLSYAGGRETRFLKARMAGTTAFGPTLPFMASAGLAP